MHRQTAIVPVILCGGSGERLWPYSNAQKPKAFLPILGHDSLLQQTIRRLHGEGLHIQDAVIVTLAQWEEEARHQTDGVAGDIRFHYILEPIGKGTLPAVALATRYAQINMPEALLWFMPCDHYFAPETNFAALLDKAVSAHDSIVLFGAKPDKAETGYGYIQTLDKTEEPFEITHFVEKPAAAQAQEFIKSGSWHWNTGMYASFVDKMHKTLQDKAPQIVSALTSADLQRPAPHIYERIGKTSFETQILESCSDLVMVSVETLWADMGQWKNIWEAGEKDDNGNVLQGQVLCDNVQNSLVYGNGRLISCIGLKNTVVIDTEDTVLVAHIDSAETLRTFVTQADALRRKSKTFNIRSFVASSTDADEDRKAGAQ